MDSREVRELMEAYIDVYASEEEIDEVYKGKHGQTDTEYADSRSPGGKMVSGDSKMSGAEYTHGRRVKAANPGMQPDVGGKTKPKSQGRMDAGTRADLMYRKANLRKQNLNMGDDFANWVDALLDEGYDLSDYTWDEVYEAYTELLEANSGYNMDKINKDPLAAMTPATFLKPKEPGQQFASPRRKGPGGGRIPPSMAPSRTAAAVADITRGSERNISASRRLPKEPKTTKMVKKDGKWVKEAFDIVLAHLVNEGYANDFDSARKIMINMSEEWIHSIVENN